jgi:hypothetical protein
VSQYVDIDIRDEVQFFLSGRVSEDRAFHPADAKAWDKVLGELAGHEVRLALSRFKARTPPQNRLLWGVYRDIMGKLRGKYADIHQVCPLAGEDELHEVMKARYIPGQRVEILGVSEVRPGSSTKLSTTEFSRYVERVVSHAAEWGCYVSLPGDLIEGWGEWTAESSRVSPAGS